MILSVQYSRSFLEKLMQILIYFLCTYVLRLHSSIEAISKAWWE